MTWQRSWRSGASLCPAARRLEGPQRRGRDAGSEEEEEDSIFFFFFSKSKFFHRPLSLFFPRLLVSWLSSRLLSGSRERERKISFEEEHAEHAARGEAQRESKRSANAREKKLKNQDGRASKKGKKKRTTKFTLDLCPFRQGRCGASWWASRLSFYQSTTTRPLIPASLVLAATCRLFLSPRQRGKKRRGGLSGGKGASFSQDETAGITRNAAAVAAGVDRLFFFFFACCCTPPGDSEEAPCLSPPPQRRRQIRSHLPGCGFARGTPLPVS